MLSRVLCVLLCAMLLGAMPSGAVSESSSMYRYTQTFYGAFDTVITLIGYAENEETFNTCFDAVRSVFTRCHQVYDGYNAYEGIGNLYRLNHAAEGEAVPVEQELMDLILWVRDRQSLTKGRVNIAMGSVLSIWHTYREEGTQVPPMEELSAAAEHTGLDTLILDEDALTITKTDGAVQIDLGAVAKGYTVERAAQMLFEGPMTSFIINAGGNVRCGGKPFNGKLAWSIGIENPDSPGNWLDLIYVNSTSVVTSGDYQRYYTVDGIRYHHIIDPDTLMPAGYMRSVTVVTEDSALADLLSTALFNMSYEDGRALVEELPGTEAYWCLNDGRMLCTEGLEPLLYSKGAVNQ